MISRGLLICSFYLKKKYSRAENEICELNQEYEYDENVYADFFELFRGFVENFSELTDDEKMMKMFAVDQESVNQKIQDTYTVASGIINSGAYGTEGELTNKTTKEVVYKRGTEDADIKSFNYTIYVPRDKKKTKVTKGIMLFETIGSYGVKTITIQNMKRFFSEKYGLTLETRSISVRIFLEKLLKDDKLSRITLIKNSVSRDPSDNMFYNVGREEKSFIRPRLKDGWINKLLEKIDGKLDDDIFEIDDEIYDDIKMTFSHSGRTKTVRLMDIDRFSLVEDIPESVYPRNITDRGKLLEYMEMTACQYAEKMIFIHE